MAKELRPYQKEAIIAVQNALQRGVKKQIIVLPTGCGKTYTAVKTLADFKRKMWCVDREELLEQAGVAFLSDLAPDVPVAKLVDQNGGLIEFINNVKSQGVFAPPEYDVFKKIGIVKAEHFDIDSEIILSSIQTLHRRLDRIPKDHFDAIVQDECHGSCSTTARKIINYFTPRLLLGLTATPHRADGGNLGDIYDDIVYQYPMLKAFEEGYLCELDAIQIRTDLNLDNVKTTAGEFNQRDLRQEVDTDARNNLIYESYKKYADGKLNVIFCVDIEHAKNVTQKLTEKGEKAEIFVSDQEVTSDRRGTLNRFKSGEITHLVNVGLFTTGMDVPSIGCITMARPTKSLTLFMQMIGRGTRTLPGTIDGIDNPEGRREAIAKSNKPNCLVLDICDSSYRHKLVNTWSLDQDKPVEQRLFTTTKKKEKIIESREKLFQANRAKDQRVSLFPLPKVVLSDSIRMKDPATMNQLMFLDKLGYDVKNYQYSKGDANRLISNAPASVAQIYVLKKNKYDVSKGVTIAEARLAFEQIEKKKFSL